MVMKVCPLCGCQRLRRSVETYVTKRHGRRLSVPRIEIYRCPRCGEGFLTDEAMRRIDERSRRDDAA
jgi:YgiT-type zinc finger domain-containing protein